MKLFTCELKVINKFLYCDILGFRSYTTIIVALQITMKTSLIGAWQWKYIYTHNNETE
jgi:hypothetical protein